MDTLKTIHMLLRNRTLRRAARAAPARRAARRRGRRGRGDHGANASSRATALSFIVPVGGGGGGGCGRWAAGGGRQTPVGVERSWGASCDDVSTGHAAGRCVPAPCLSVCLSVQLSTYAAGRVSPRAGLCGPDIAGLCRQS